MDFVYLRNIPFELPVGPDAWQRTDKPQPVLISLRIDQSENSQRLPKYDKSIEEAATSDDVSKTLDYGKLYKSLSSTVTSTENRFATVAEVADVVAKSARTHDSFMRGGKIEVTLPKAILRADGLAYVAEIEWAGQDMYRTETLRVKGIRCACIIGVNKHERLQKQEVIVSLEFADRVLLDRKQSLGQTPTIQPVIASFHGLTKAVIERVEGSSYQTVEALATAIAQTVTMDFKIPTVTVNVDKPNAIAGIEVAGVQLRRSASFFKDTDFWGMQQ